MRYNIFRGTNVVASNIYLEGTVAERIMAEETTTISFSATYKIEFHIGDRITVYGKDYFLSAEPVIVKNNSRDFNYSMVFFSIKYSLSDIKLFFYDNDGELTIPDFSIMGTASTCLDAVLINANRVSLGWTKGNVDDTEVKNVSFSDSNCLEAISKIADDFKLEYWIDSDKSIHFTVRKPVSGYSFEYGKAKGLKNITRSVLEGGSLVTRLYVKGAETNLPKNYRGGQKNLRINVPFLEKNIILYGIKEHTENFTEIYPKRVGTVTTVDAADPNRFSDADLDFDLNAYNEYGSLILMNGVAAKIIFQTGQLAGYRLELIEAGGFNSATKTFYLNPNKDEKDLIIPSDLIRPAIGDTYIIEDIMMPQTYVAAAEIELKTKGQEYLDQNSKERFQYAVESDVLYFKNQNINVQLGSTVNFKDNDFGLDDAIRITGMQKNIQNPFDVKFDLSEVTAVSSIVQSYYEQQEQTTTIINNIKYNAELARRNYLFSREFHDNVFDGEGYFDAENIKPLSIETKMLSLGSRLQQFGLPGVNFKIQNNNSLQNTAGKIAHQTIDPNAIREWIIAQNTVIGISNNFNYIFIKCQKTGINANFVVTETPIKVEQDADFYHFEVGYLSSVLDGYRKIKTTFGFAQLNPAELSIGRVSDPTGNNYIDLLQDKIAIKAKVEFTSDSPAFDQVNASTIIGGRNYFKKTTPISAYNCTVIDRDNVNAPNGVSCVGQQSADGNLRLSNVVTGNGKYTISFEARGNQNVTLPFTLDFCDQTPKTLIIPGNNNWTKYSYTWEVTNYSSGTYNFVDIGGLSWAYYFFKNIKVEKGTKATDWTPAPEDLQSQIDQVNANAVIVNGLISDISNDNKITPSEKQDLKKENDIIVGENPQIFAQAQLYLSAGAFVNYTNAYNTLITYIAPFLVNLTTTSNIDGASLRGNFVTYFSEKAKLLKAVTDAISNNFSEVYTYISEVQFDFDQELNDVTNQLNGLDTYINGAFSDGVISKAEAIAIEKYINQINTEKSELTARYTQVYGNSFLGGVPKTNLASAWTAYGNAHTALINSINSAIADGKTTPAEKADVDAKFVLYRSALSTLTTRIQEALKKIEDEAILNIQIGGRNYYRKTATPIDVLPGLLLFLRNTPETPYGFQITGSSTQNKGIRVYNVINSNGFWTVSFDMKGSQNAAVGFYLDICDSGQTRFTVTPDNKWKRFSLTVNVTNYSAEVYNFVDFDSIDYAYLYFRNIKIEKGNKATDWMPAPEDVQDGIDSANSNSALALAQALNAQNTAASAALVTSFLQTTVDGNVVSTGTLQVGDVVGANAMISGVTDKAGGESIRFAAGKPYAQKYLSPFQVLDNGMMRFVNPVTGKTTFELGFNQFTQKVVFNIYNNTGVRVATISENGIAFTGYQAESYYKRNLRKAISTSFNIPTLTGELSRSMLNKFVMINEANVGLVTDQVSFEYNAGRNFESADNAQYEGLYTTANKFGTKIPSGIYFAQVIIRVYNVNTVPDFIYSTTAYNVINGKIIDALPIEKTFNLGLIGNRPNDFPPEDFG